MPRREEECAAEVGQRLAHGDCRPEERREGWPGAPRRGGIRRLYGFEGPEALRSRPIDESRALPCGEPCFEAEIAHGPPPFGQVDASTRLPLHAVVEMRRCLRPCPMCDGLAQHDVP